ncbi:hypothetical protein E8E11_000533 [Didymella keratinophila]|nr:hypothetical protein E8E11_000533 [Didymella keratinophila]
MLFQSTIIALLASASLVAGAAFPDPTWDHDKMEYQTTCKAYYKTKAYQDYYKSTYYKTETKSEPYVTHVTKTYVIQTDQPYTETEYKTNTKYRTETYYETKKVPATAYTEIKYPVYKTKTETYVDKKPVIKAKHVPYTKTKVEDKTVYTTKYKTETKETHASTTKYKTETEQKCETIKCHLKGCTYKSY